MQLLLLLLLLLAGCVTSAQMTSSSPPLSASDASALTAALLSLGRPIRVLPSAASAHNVIAVLQATVRSDMELNETALPSVLNLLHGFLQELQPDVTFTLSMRNITQV